MQYSNLILFNYFFHDTCLIMYLVNVVKEAGCVAEYVDIIDMLYVSSWAAWRVCWCLKILYLYL